MEKENKIQSWDELMAYLRQKGIVRTPEQKVIAAEAQQKIILAKNPAKIPLADRMETEGHWFDGPEGKKRFQTAFPE